MVAKVFLENSIETEERESVVEFLGGIEESTSWEIFEGKSTIWRRIAFAGNAKILEQLAHSTKQIPEVLGFNNNLFFFSVNSMFIKECM